MINLTPEQCFDYACAEYSNAKSIISDLSETAMKVSENFSYEIAMKQFDMILQAILINIAVDDKDFCAYELAFIKNITDYADVLAIVNANLKKQNAEWVDIEWAHINHLEPENKDKFAIICAAVVSGIADDFTKYFAPIDVIDDRDFLNELQACIFKISILLASIDEGGIQDLEDGNVPSEQLRGIAIYEKLFRENWQKYMDAFMNS